MSTWEPSAPVGLWPTRDLPGRAPVDAGSWRAGPANDPDPAAEGSIALQPKEASRSSWRPTVRTTTAGRAAAPVRLGACRTTRIALDPGYLAASSSMYTK